jgi:hypothetical protein
MKVQEASRWFCRAVLRTLGRDVTWQGEQALAADEPWATDEGASPWVGSTSPSRRETAMPWLGSTRPRRACTDTFDERSGESGSIRKG